MTKVKKNTIIGILALIIFLSGGFISMDWLRLFERSAKPEYFDYPFTSLMKIPVSFLCFILVWMIGKDSVNIRDTKRLKLAFTFIFIADLTLFFGKTIPGIILFALCQILLIFRNGSGILKFFSSKTWMKYKFELGIYAIVATIICAGALRFIFYPMLKGKALFYILIIYSVLLMISLWLAWVCHEIRNLPRENTCLIAIGMTCFVLCDFTVGFDLAIKTLDITSNTVLQWMISSSLTWMFYTPALVILAFSGYDLGKLKSVV